MIRSRLLYALGTVALVGGLTLLALVIVEGGDLLRWAGAIGGTAGALSALAVGREYARRERSLG